jgi:hypothetical protein
MLLVGVVVTAAAAQFLAHLAQLFWVWLVRVDWALAFLEGPLHVGVDVDPAHLALLPHVCPAVATFPLPEAAGAPEFTVRPSLALVRRQVYRSSRLLFLGRSTALGQTPATSVRWRSWWWCSDESDDVAPVMRHEMSSSLCRSRRQRQ